MKAFFISLFIFVLILTASAQQLVNKPKAVQKESSKSIQKVRPTKVATAKLAPTEQTQPATENKPKDNVRVKTIKPLVAPAKIKTIDPGKVNDKAKSTKAVPTNNTQPVENTPQKKD